MRLDSRLRHIIFEVFGIQALVVCFRPINPRVSGGVLEGFRVEGISKSCGSDFDTWDGARQTLAFAGSGC